ncbi:hypothetical protein QUF64_01440 [Anaerolineales bacterium HSG6]|nr:hypothetical protein [Anaerolineales bacterium HSG6]MDM8532875.1 hypothetical protein [Anaerolineales bacterium HSG25]
MKFDILTLFPELFAGVFETSIIGRAVERGFVEITLHNIRDHALGKHRVTDDTPYGGGGGMIMKPDPIFYAVEALLDIEMSHLKTFPARLLVRSSNLSPRYFAPLF